MSREMVNGMLGVDLDPGVSIMDVRLMMPLPDGPRPAAPPVRHLGLDQPFTDAPELLGLGIVLDQDVENMRALLRGLPAAPQAGLTVSDYRESRIRHYHQRLEEWISR